MDPENIGKEKFGVVVLDGGADAEDTLRWCDLALVTGTTVVNGTIGAILEVAGAKAVFYGISIAGLPGCLVSSGFVRDRREWGVEGLWRVWLGRFCWAFVFGGGWREVFVV